jgi:uncharacterized membrane protein YfcA
MNHHLIEFIIGIISGLLLGITGVSSTGLIILAIDALGIYDYKSIVGTILFISLFPISIGAAWEFNKSKKMAINMGYILLTSIILGGFLGSKLVFHKDIRLSNKTMKLLTSGVGFLTGVLFLISGYYEEN